MKNKLLSRVLRVCPLALTTIAMIIWFIGILGVQALKPFTFIYVALIFFCAYSISFLLRAIFENKDDAILKRTWLIMMGSFLVGFFICLIFALPLNIDVTVGTVISGVLVALGVAVTLSLIFRGPKKWDEGDNEKEGYKTYRERKAEELKNKEKQDEE